MDAVNPNAWADLIKMVGFPILVAGYFMWKDYRLTQRVADDLAVIRAAVMKEPK